MVNARADNGVHPVVDGGDHRTWFGGIASRSGLYAFAKLAPRVRRIKCCFSLSHASPKRLESGCKTARRKAGLNRSDAAFLSDLRLQSK